MAISSILPKTNNALTRLTRQVKASLREMCVLNKFGFIPTDNVSRTYLWKDGIHLGDLRNNIVAGNFVNILNRFILSKSSEHPWLYTDKNSKDRYGNIGAQISDNSLSPEMVSDIGNLGSVSSNMSSVMLKIWNILFWSKSSLEKSNN